MYQASSYPIYVVIRQGNIAGEQRGRAGKRALRRLLASAGIGAAEEKNDEVQAPRLFYLSPFWASNSGIARAGAVGRRQ